MRENTLRNIIFGLGAFISSFALTLIFEITVRNPLTVVFFVLIFAELKKLDERGMFSKLSVKSAAGGVLAAVLGGVLSCVLRGKELSSGFNSGIFKLLTMVILFAGMSCLLFIGYVILLHYFFYKNMPGENEIIEKSAEAKSENSVSKSDSIHGKKLFAITFIICMICYLPYFLYEFPGIMTADSLVQYEQIVGIRPWSNHHPVVHTLLIKLFYSIGLTITGAPNTAISF